MQVEPGTDSALTIARYRAHISEGMAMLSELMDAHVEARSEGTRIWDEEGTEYLDCGGFGVFLLGHRYPRVVAAVHEQLDRHPMSSRVLLNGDQRGRPSSWHASRPTASSTSSSPIPARRQPSLGSNSRGSTAGAV